MLFNYRGALGACAILAAALGVSSPVSAQDSAAEAEAEFRVGMVHLIEQALFSATKKTAMVIYAKHYRLGGHDYLFCGAALFGSTPDLFLFGTESTPFIRAPTKEQWRANGCDEPRGEVLIDLR